MANEVITIERLTDFHNNMTADANILKRSTAYSLNNIVNKGLVYLKCTTAGTTDSAALSLSGVVVGDTLTDNTVEWEVISISGVPYDESGGIDVWETAKSYEIDDVVLFNDIIYKCNTNHTSSTFVSDIAYWDYIYSNIKEWQASTYYKVGATVIAQNKLYKCITAHTSGSSWNGTNWQYIGKSGSEINNWESGLIYDSGVVVIYDGILYRCTTNHTSTSSFDESKWESVYTTIPVWASSKLYKAGQIVEYNGMLYKCNTNHTSSAFNTDIGNWTLLSKIRTWAASTAYYQGEIIKHEDILYLVTTTHVSASTFSLANLSFLNITRLLEWQANKWYTQGSIIRVNDVIYYANESHQANATAFSNDIAKWTAINANIRTFVSNQYYPLGSLVIHNDKVYKCIVANNGEKDPALGYYWKEISNRAISPWRGRRSTLVVNNVTSLLHFEEDVLFDEIYTNKWFRTYGDGSPPKLDTTDPKIGSGCASLQHWGRMMRCENVLDIFGTTDLRNVVATIEFWGKTTGGVGNDVAEMFNIQRPNAGGQTIISTDDFLYPMPSSMNYNEWTHIAMVFNNSLTYKVYINGTYLGDYSIPDSTVMATISAIEIGNNHTYIYSYMDEFIITQAVKYTEDFTPSTTQLNIGLYGYYEVNDYVSYNGKIYRCIERNADLLFDETKWEELGGSTEEPMQIWQTNTEYKEGQVVIYNYSLYKCKETHISSSSNFITDKNKWDSLCASTLVWNADLSYKIGTMVLYNNQLYRCIFDNNDSSWVGSHWQLINSIDTWNYNTYYPYHVLVVYDGTLYRCIVSHTSTSTFNEENWEELSGGGSGGGSGTGYSQVEALNVLATLENPYVVDISINSNATHTLAPTDVLKYKEGIIKTESMMEFVSSDVDMFNYDSRFVDFGGKLKLNTNVEIPLGTVSSLGDKYLRISDNIDLTEFKSVDRVVCV